MGALGTLLWRPQGDQLSVGALGCRDWLLAAAVTGRKRGGIREPRQHRL